MRDKIVSTAFLLLLAIACPFATSAAPNQAAQSHFYMCRAMSGVYQIYVSGINPLGASVRDIQIAWISYVNKTYDVHANDNTADCFTGTESQMQQQQASLRRQTSIARNGKFVETGWKFVPDAATAASKPGGIYGYCQSGTYAKGTIYLSDIFEVPREDAMSTNSPVDKTFIPYLNKRYGLSGTYTDWYQGSGGCTHSFGGVTDAQNGKQRMLDSAKKANQRVVETGWKYARTADTPPPNGGANSH